MQKHKENPLNKALVEIKEAKKLTAYRIAKMSGFANPTVNNWLTGKHEIRASQLKHIGKCFGLEVNISVTIN